MARGRWIRWGRGSCEGYSLDIGYGAFSFRANVVRNVIDVSGANYTWRADLYGRSIANDLPDRETGFGKIEFELRDGMRHIIEDWKIFEAAGRSSVGGYGKKRR